MADIGLNQLDAVLSALGDLLEASGEFNHLVVIGGSGLVAINAVSRTTRDVDVVALLKDGALISAEPLPPAVAAAAAVVARDLGLEKDWLNADPTSLLDLGLPTGFAERLTGRDYGSALRVFVRIPHRSDLLQALRRSKPSGAARLRRPPTTRADTGRAARCCALGAHAQHARPIRR